MFALDECHTQSDEERTESLRSCWPHCSRRLAWNRVDLWACHGPLYYIYIQNLESSKFLTIPYHISIVECSNALRVSLHLLLSRKEHCRCWIFIILYVFFVLVVVLAKLHIYMFISRRFFCWSRFRAITVLSIFIDDASCLFPFGLKVIWNGYTYTRARFERVRLHIKMLSPLASYMMCA